LKKLKLNYLYRIEWNRYKPQVVLVTRVFPLTDQFEGVTVNHKRKIKMSLKYLKRHAVVVLIGCVDDYPEYLF